MTIASDELDRRTQDGVLSLTLRRDDARNALSKTLIMVLAEALARADADQSVHTIVLSGGERHFCTGLDLAEAAADSSQREGLPDLFAALASSSKLVIAKVRGEVAAGGLGLCAACDVVVAEPRTVFRLPEILWGLTPALVLPWLVRRVGLQKARELTLTARSLGGAEAHRIHLVDILSEDLDQTVAALCLRNARVPAGAVRAAKAYFDQLWPVGPTQLALAREAHHQTFADEDVKQRLRQFAERGVRPWQE